MYRLSSPATPRAEIPIAIHGPAATAGVVPVRSGTSATIVPCSQWSTKSIWRPSGL